MSAIVAKCLIDINETLSKMNELIRADVSNVSSWKDVQTIVRRGIAPAIFPIGTMFGVDRGTETYYFEVAAHNHYDVGTYSMTLVSNNKFINSNFNRNSLFYYTQPNNYIYVYIPNTIAHSSVEWSAGYYLVPKDISSSTQYGTVASYITGVTYSSPFNKSFSDYSTKTSFDNGTFYSSSIYHDTGISQSEDIYETITTDNMYDYVCGRIDYLDSVPDLLLNMSGTIASLAGKTYGDGAQGVNYDGSIAFNKTNGFLFGLDEEFVEVVKTTPVKYQKKSGTVSTLNRKFFIPSADELGHNATSNSSATATLGEPFELYEKTGSKLFSTSAMTRNVSTESHKTIYVVGKTSQLTNKLKECFPSEDYIYIFPCCTIY